MKSRFNPLFKKPGAALLIYKGIASVDSLEGGLGNMRAADRVVDNRKEVRVTSY
ncbi:MAG: hypothetical protein ABIF87_01480 [Pseudomonadota bacterium]